MSKRLTALVLTATLVSLRPVGAQTRVGIDEGHFNVHTATTTYLPFVEALRAAGFTVTSTTERFSAESLADLDVLVIANARASSTGPLEERGKPAFSAAELEGIESWVRKGGGLLLVVDHYPVGGANAQLGLRFGIDILNGRTVDRALARTEIAGRVALSAGGSAETNEHLIFESASKTLGAHPILCRAGQEVNRVGRSAVLRSVPQMAQLHFLSSLTQRLITSGRTAFHDQQQDEARHSRFKLAAVELSCLARPPRSSTSITPPWII